MESIVIIGGGGHCKSCIDVIESTDKFIIKYIVDTPNKFGVNFIINSKALIAK